MKIKKKELIKALKEVSDFRK
ncbi:MAG: Unknown protein, partial [uncultured Sulfurovum sp.]